mgnify:CR=1 FL=1
MSKREQIEAQIQALRLQIEKLEKSLSSQNNTETPWSVVDVGEEGFTFTLMRTVSMATTVSDRRRGTLTHSKTNPQPRGLPMLSM